MCNQLRLCGSVSEILRSVACHPDCFYVVGTKTITYCIDGVILRVRCSPLKLQSIIATGLQAYHHSMDGTINVWVDGSCLNNGTSVASSAIGIYYGLEDMRNFSSRLAARRQTNNRAELLAILYVVCTNLTTASLRIHTDSQYSIKCLTEYHHRWKLNGWVTSKGECVESVDIIKYILNTLTKRDDAGSLTELVHVRGHSDNIGNNAADTLANEAAHGTEERGRIRLLRRFGAPF